MRCLQEITQSVGTTPNKVEVTSSNPPSCVDMSKKKPQQGPQLSKNDLLLLLLLF
jgi:hypothetical protein